MLKKLTVPAALALLLASCALPGSGDSNDATTTVAPTTTAAETTVAETTAAPTTAAETTVAETTAAPTTAAETTVAETAPAPTTTEGGGGQAAVNTGDLDVITVSGIGAPVESDAEIESLSSVGFSADSPATFLNFGPALYPFVNIEGARLIELRLATNDYAHWRYTYLINNSAAQTPEQLAQAAAAPVKERYPSATESTATRVDGTRSYYSVDLEGADTDPDWSVIASTDTDAPDLTFISIELDNSIETPITGPAVVPPAYTSVVDEVLAQAKLSADNLTGITVDAGIGYGSPSSDVEIEIDFPGASFAEAIDSLRPLTSQGYEIDESDSDYTTFRSDTVSFQVFNNDDSENRPTDAYVRIEVV